MRGCVPVATDHLALPVGMLGMIAHGPHAHCLARIPDGQRGNFAPHLDTLELVSSKGEALLVAQAGCTESVTFSVIG